MSFVVGELITISQNFTNSSGVDADPTVVTLWVREELDGTELEFTYNASPVAGTHYPVGMNPIVKDSTGDYHNAFNARKPERITAQWVGAGTVLLKGPETFFVRHSAIVALEP